MEYRTTCGTWNAKRGRALGLLLPATCEVGWLLHTLRRRAPKRTTGRVAVPGFLACNVSALCSGTKTHGTYPFNVAPFRCSPPLPGEVRSSELRNR